VADTSKKLDANLITKWKDKKILVIGDVGVDEYVLGPVRRISPEAPVPILEVAEESEKLGLGANVAQNIKSLGAEPLLIGLTGQDKGGEVLDKLLIERNISVNYLVKSKSRMTTRKMRIISGQHHLVRVDYEYPLPPSESEAKELFGKIQLSLPLCDLVILQDYAKGTFTKEITQKIIEICHAHKKIILVDPHRSRQIDFYKNADLIKPNFEEAIGLARWNLEEANDTNEYIQKLSQYLAEVSGAQQIIITRGKLGMSIFEKQRLQHIPTYARQVFDVTGAGDTVIATLALGLAAGIDLQSVGHLSNLAAGIVVAQVGCVACTAEELKIAIQSAEIKSSWS
jgi:rfaE bifunctional protein kinase chain/domain